MKAKEIKRLIELLIEAHIETYRCEGVCFLGDAERELNNLIEKYQGHPLFKNE
jgi:hypothetical protein